MVRVVFYSCLFALTLLGASAAAAPDGVHPKKSADVVDAPRLSETAIKHFNAGVAYVDDPAGPKWEEAYREFLAAYADTSYPWRRLEFLRGFTAGRSALSRGS